MYPFESCFYPDICPGMGLQCHMIALFLSFLRNLHTVLNSGCTNLLSNSIGGFIFSIPSPAFIVCRFFDYIHSGWCKLIAHCSLNYISLIFSNVEHLFMCICLAIYLSFFGKYLFSNFASIYWVVCFDAVKHHELFLNFGD